MIRSDKGKTLFVVEVGWKGMREASLAYLKDGFSTDIVIKGKVDKEVLNVITRPDNNYRIRAIPRWFFRIYLSFYLLWQRILGNLEVVIASKERTRGWIKGFGIDAKLLIEKDAGYELR